MAGAGTGRIPCSVRTVPLPTLIGAAVDRFDAEIVETEARADDVADRIDRADFVEVHFLDRRSRASSTRTAPSAGTRRCELVFTRSGKRRLADHLLDVMQMPVGFRIGAVDMEFAGGDAPALGLLEAERRAGSERSERFV